MTVTLDTWGPRDFQFPMADYLQSNWGNEPLRTGQGKQNPEWNVAAHVQSAFQGHTLQQVLEGITFWFTIDGVARACTHQIVRTRFASFMQHGGRDNDWRHRRWTMPETIRRAIRRVDRMIRPWITLPAGRPFTDESWEQMLEREDWLEDCITDERPLHQFMARRQYANLGTAVQDTLARCKELYAALVDAGIPWQDARRLLPMGTQTYIHAIYNYVSLKGFLANRLEFIMDWEINCVAQLMLREIRMKCPAVIGDSLMSHSDAARKAKFAGLESWPPDGKYPNPHERCICGHAAENHTKGDDHVSMATRGEDGDMFRCHECICVAYRPQDTLPRTHNRRQMPFWILAPESMAGGPIRWIPTNGTYPKELRTER